MAKLPFILAILIVSFCQLNAFPNIMNITEVVSYARNIVDTIKDLNSPSAKLENESDNQLAPRINFTRRLIIRMIEGKIFHNRRETNIVGIRHILTRNNLTIFILNDTILNSLLPEQKVQININKILIKSNNLIQDLPQFGYGAYNELQGMIQQLRRKLHVDTIAYERALRNLFMVTMQSESKFRNFATLASMSSTLSVYPDMFRRLSAGILESRADELINQIYPMFTVLTAHRVPGFYKALNKYLDDNQNNFKFEDICEVDVPYQDQIKQIYETVLLIDYRIFIMTIATRKYMEILREGDYNGELLVETRDFISRAEHYLQAMKMVMSKAPRDIKRCDLKEDIEENSFHLSNLSAETDAASVISLIPQVADFDNNMVVTNVRLQKKDNIVHVQIQQGRLLPGGAINQSTLKWLPLDNIVRTENVTSPFEKLQGGKLVPLVYDKNFTYLRQGEAKLNIDDINLPVNYVVTGVTFEKLHANDINQWSSNAIGLKVLATPFDYYTGTLNPTDKKPSEWLSANELLKLNVRGSYSKVEVARINKFVDFDMQKTSNDSEEVTLPYFDSRPAGIVSSTSLSGIGIVQRETANNSSFLLPKLIAVDHSEYVIAEMNPSQTEFFTHSQDYYEHHQNEDTDDDDGLFHEEYMMF